MTFLGDPESFSFLARLIYRHSGIQLSWKDAAVLWTPVSRRMRDLALTSATEYLGHLQGPSAAEEIPALVDAVTINYTYFFREAHHFQFLGSEVFPRLLARRPQSGGTIRGWSAGCSSGEEAYSIAVVFAEAVADVGSQDFRILATDINRRVLRIGARGIYPESRLSSFPQEYRYKYLTRDGETPTRSLRVTPELRRLVVFRRFNVLDGGDALRGAFDFIFCRNVMIYFDAATLRALLHRFHEALRPGGYLFVGSKEISPETPNSFRSVSRGVFRKS